MLGSLGRPRLRIVTGKGGVGKTVVATAMALAEVRQGRRVLLAECQAGDQVSALLGVPAVGATMKEVLPGLSIVDINARDAIHEYALMTLKFEVVYKAVFENRLVRHFLRAVPSLAELVILGKLWFHEQEQHGQGPRFDALIFDAPATGHAISMLRTPRAVATTVPAGPLRDNAAQIARLLVAERTRLHVVTTPEEMPVNEAVRLEYAATDVLNMVLGPLVINQRLSPLPSVVLADLKPLQSEPRWGGVVEALHIREGRRRAGERQLRRLPARTLASAQSLPRLVCQRFGRKQVEALSCELEPMLEQVHEEGDEG